MDIQKMTCGKEVRFSCFNVRNKMRKFFSILFVMFFVNNILLSQLIYKQIPPDDADGYTIKIDKYLPLDDNFNKVSLLVLRKDPRVNSQIDNLYEKSVRDFFRQIVSFNTLKLEVVTCDFTGEPYPTKKLFSFSTEQLSRGKLHFSDFYIITTNKEIIKEIEKSKNELRLSKSSYEFPNANGNQPIAFPV